MDFLLLLNSVLDEVRLGLFSQPAVCVLFFLSHTPLLEHVYSSAMQLWPQMRTDIGRRRTNAPPSSASQLVILWPTCDYQSSGNISKARCRSKGINAVTFSSRHERCGWTTSGISPGGLNIGTVRGSCSFPDRLGDAGVHIQATDAGCRARCSVCSSRPPALL